MHKKIDLKKILLFGLLGAIGCLLGWAGGERLLKFGLPWAKRFASNGGIVRPIITPPEPTPLPAPVKERLSVPEPSAPPPIRAPSVAEPSPPSPEFAERLAREGAKSGDVEIGLMWWNTNDLDLHVFDPAGEEIYYDHKKAASGGELDVDMNAGSNFSQKPVEHVYFPTGGAPVGRYSVSVVHYNLHGGGDPTRYRVYVKANGQYQEFSGSISFAGVNANKAYNLICTFDVKPPTPQMSLTIPERMSILSGDSNEFKARIARGFFNGPVSLRLEGDTRGLSASEVTIPSYSDSITMPVQADSGARTCERTVRVVASGQTSSGTICAQQLLTINVIEPPAPVLKLAIPDSIQIKQNDANRFKVRIGRYFFPGTAPAVTIRVESNDPGIEGEQQIITSASSEGIIELRATKNASGGTRDIRVIASTEGSSLLRAESRMAVEVIPLPDPGPLWPVSLVIGSWTALLALGLSFLLVIGQNRYLGHPILTFKQAVFLLFGGSAAGMLAGGCGQLLLTWLDRTPSSPVPPMVGQVAGWVLLGLLLGGGVAFYIPNLPGGRASVAGGVGGFLGVAGFLYLAHSFGDATGRVTGAVILGFAIGSMIALMHEALREAWLEVEYGPKELRTVSLGAEPVSIGGDHGSCTIRVRCDTPVAYRYWIKDNAIHCEDVRAKRTFQVAQGDRKQVGNVTVTVRSAEKKASKQATTGAASRAASVPTSGAATKSGEGLFVLNLSTGKKIKLRDGLNLSASDLPGLKSASGSIVATVTSHPTDTTIHGLKNMSATPWRVRLPSGEVAEIMPQRIIRLAAGTKVNFGAVSGEITC